MTEQNLDTYLELTKIGYGTDPDNAHGDAATINGQSIAEGFVFNTDDSSGGLYINEVESGVRILAMQDEQGNSTVVFRGTDNIVNAQADAGLANSTFLSEAARAEISAYVASAIDSGKQVTFVGHSYGMNLALNAALSTAKELDPVLRGRSQSIADVISVVGVNGAGLPEITDEQRAILDPMTTNYRSVIEGSAIAGSGIRSAGDIVSALFWTGRTLEFDVPVSAVSDGSNDFSGLGAAVGLHMLDNLIGKDGAQNRLGIFPEQQ